MVSNVSDFCVVILILPNYPTVFVDIHGPIFTKARQPSAAIFCDRCKLGWSQLPQAVHEERHPRGFNQNIITIHCNGQVYMRTRDDSSNNERIMNESNKVEWRKTAINERVDKSGADMTSPSVFVRLNNQRSVYLSDSTINVSST
eukprot:scaffold1296_cov74-Cyclotella_meneghiniana.AAC.3